MQHEIDRTRETTLILRTCNSDMTGYNSFQWPESGYVEAPDWEPTVECGNVLHGWLKGDGNTNLGYLSVVGYKALVVETYTDHIIELDGKVKFPFGWVIFAGDLTSAAAMIQVRYPDTKVIGGTATAGDGGMLIIQRWNGKRYKFAVAEVGDGGLKPNVMYRLNGDGVFVEVENA